MDKLIDLMTGSFPWIGMLTLCLVFAFAPTTILRVLVKAWPRNHPRRRELMAEVHTIAYWERPLWVFEQLESAVFDGLHIRFRHKNALKVLSAYLIVLLELVLLPFTYTIGILLTYLAVWALHVVAPNWRGGLGYPPINKKGKILGSDRMIVGYIIALVIFRPGIFLSNCANGLEEVQEDLVGERLIEIGRKTYKR